MTDDTAVFPAAVLKRAQLPEGTTCDDCEARGDRPMFAVVAIHGIALCDSCLEDRAVASGGHHSDNEEDDNMDLDFAPVELTDALDVYRDEAADESFRCDTEDKAIWAADKLADALHEAAEREATAARQIERIQLWLEDANRGVLDRAAFFQSLLEDYHRQLFLADPKKKTVKLPGATTSLRKAPDQWEFDADTFLAWAKEHAPDAVRTPDPQVDKPAAKKLLAVTDDGVTFDGEAVPGVTVTEGQIGFSVKVVD